VTNAELFRVMLQQSRAGGGWQRWQRWHLD
jgi:hypothetical protein